MWVNTAVSWECQVKQQGPSQLYSSTACSGKNRVDLIEQVYPRRAPCLPGSKGKYTTVLNSASDGWDWQKIKAKKTRTRKVRRRQAGGVLNLHKAGSRALGVAFACKPKCCQSEKKGPNSVSLWEICGGGGGGLEAVIGPFQMIPEDLSNALTAERRWRRRLAQI